MRDRTKAEFIKEVELLRREVAELRQAESQRQKVEEALKESEAQKRILLDNSPDMILHVDRNMKVLWANKTALDISSAAVGQACHKAYMGSDQPCEGCPCKKALETGQIQMGVMHRPAVEGVRGDRYWEDIGVPLKDDNGETVGVIEIARNITQRKRTEEALRKERDRAQRYLDIAGGAIVVIDANEKVSLVNRKGCEVLGYEEGEIVGRNWFDTFLPDRHRERIRAVFASLMAGEIEPVEYVENPVVTKNGEERVIAWHNTVLRGEKGNITATLGSGEDITDRKRAEETLRESEEFRTSLLNNSPVSVLVAEEDTTIRYVNPALEERTGYSAAELVGTKAPYPYWTEETLHKTGEDLAKAMHQGARHVPELFQRKDGEKFWAEISSTPVLRDGKYQYYLANWIDVTEREKFGEALKESEERHRSFIVSSHEAIFSKDRDGHYHTLNLEAAIGLGGTSVEDIEGKTDHDLLPKEQADALREIDEQVMGSGKGVEVEEVVRDAQGENRIYLSHKWPTYDDEGRTTGISCLAVDITERKKAEEEARYQRDYFRALFEGSPEGIVSTDMERRVMDINPAFEKMFGYSREELRGKDILDCHIPKGREEEGRHLSGRIVRGETVITETVRRRADWREIPVLLWGGPVVVEGKQVGILAIYQDITERKKAEEEAAYQRDYFRALFEGSPDAVVSVDMERRVMDINPAFEKMFGYSLEDIRGTDILDCHIPEGKEEEGRDINRRIAQGEVVVTETVRRGADWREIPVLLRGAPVMVEGQQVGILGMYRDISERKRAEQELTSSRQQLRELAAHLQAVREGERTSIARELHDEMGQMLTALKMDLSWLNKRLPRDETLLLDKIRAMVKLTDANIRAVKRISAQLRPGILDDLGLTAAIEWETEEFQKRTGIKCELSMDEELIVLEQDRSTAIFRIFQEALTNVSRHARANRVKASLREEAGGLVLRVVDDGKGITEKQASHPRSFGLIGMRERTLAMGGEMEIQGIPGEGTTLTVRLPLRREGETP